MKKRWYILGSVILIGMLWFAYYAISPLFRNIKLDEALPESQVVNMAQPDLEQAVSASVIGTVGHPASGTARVVEADSGRYVRYENLKTINGPDLFVYLAKDLEAKEFVSLGVLRATEGNVNYEIPDNVNPSDYRYVMTWCKQFGVLFNYADISKL